MAISVLVIEIKDQGGVEHRALYSFPAAKSEKSTKGLCLRVQAFTNERVMARTKLLNEKG
ncbi:hypothetical protein GCM10009604_22440 [Corynebacterium aurimucosum]